MKKKNSGKKYIRNLFLFMFLVWLTFRVLLKDQDLGEIFAILGNVKLQFVFCGILCMIGYFICESINLRRTLNALGENVNLAQSLKYSLIGFFYRQNKKSMCSCDTHTAII